ncbi:MAG: metal-sensitive transcriptional regulator [Thermincolia bacterium]
MSNCYELKNVSTRLAKIEGHVRAVKRMVDEEKSCEEILLQIGAVKAALNKVGRLVLEGHLEGCVLEGIREGKGEEVVYKLKSALGKYL